jgi:hypothetical protein
MVFKHYFKKSLLILINYTNMWTDFIEQNPEVLRGKPIIKGTRIGVDLILEKIGQVKLLMNCYLLILL